ncbi:bacterial alpha-L-rhamnosidase-domain-containing protein [Aspergillus spectabilis]
MSQMVEIKTVRFEHHPISSDCRNWVQHGYDIEIRWQLLGEQSTRSSTELQGYHVDGYDSLFGPWLAAPLFPREIALVRVRGYGHVGEPVECDYSPAPTAWSCAATSGEFITSNVPVDLDEPRPPFLFRREFPVPLAHLPLVERARIYATAQCLYELYLNGRRVGDQVLAPGWTEYSTRVEYQTYDVTPLLQAGSNFPGRLGYFGGLRNIWGTKIAILAMLIVDYKGGQSEVLVATGDQWKWSTSPTTSAEIYDGEHFDAQQEPVGWSTVEFNDCSWDPVRTVAVDMDILFAPLGPPIHAIEELPVKEVITSPTGKMILDFGQNLVGYIRKVITLRHAEVLEKRKIATKPLRLAKATDKVTLSGQDMDWGCKFTFHGFCYVQVDGLDGLSPVLSTTARTQSSVLFTAILHSNIVWSMRGNFVGVPTDCPQRDERLGYTGDLQAFASTGSFLYDTCGVLSTWLHGLVADQTRDESGVPPMFSPNIHRKQPNYRAAVWGDCVVIIPWELYRSFGDAHLLRTQYPSMTSWREKGVKRDSRESWDPTCTFQLGDWLDPYAPAIEPASAHQYRNQSSTLRAAFQEEYVTPSGRMVSDSQTAFAPALYFNLLPSASARDIGTGFVGTPILGHALTQCGQSQLFYRMLLHKKNPSWLYPVTMGATTKWERWDSIFDHYALGAVGDWLHKTVSGLRSLEPGWKRFAVTPVPGGGLNFAEVRFGSPYGLIEFHWKLTEDGCRLKASLLVPPNTPAELYLPGQTMEVPSGPSG